jgi:hypothetical protein
VGAIPETLTRISCYVAWRDKIFVCGFAESNGHGQVFYIFEPPPIKRLTGQAEAIGMWVAIERPENCHVGYVQRIQSAVTLEI